MEFIVIGNSARIPHECEPNTCYLKIDGWDDYTFKTLFNLHYADPTGEVKRLGSLKILKKGMTGGAERVELPNDSHFKKLDKNYCSLGQEQSYYEELMSLPALVRNDILKSLRDCVYDPKIYEDFKSERGFQTSLLRGMSTRNVEKSFRNILAGNVELTPYHFQFHLTNDIDCVLDITVKPESSPPTNVHVIIGRNGVGKTRLLSGIADELTNNKEASTMSLNGSITFPNEDEEEGRFANLITVVFSAFDEFTPIKARYVKGDIRYQYVGLKKYLEKDTQTEVLKFKSNSDLKKDFKTSLEICLATQRLERWIEAIRILNSDPIFSEYELDEVAVREAAIDEITTIFSKLSSGHKITLLSITKLVELVEERTLVLIDEPENHLHPPLLASLTRALSNLLIKRNGVALIATHSPVVLQEVPASCVTIVDRVRSKFGFYKPEIETFAENVGTLTREVFKLEVQDSGFHKMIVDHLADNDYESLLEVFDDQIGMEGRAIARSNLLNKSKD